MLKLLFKPSTFDYVAVSGGIDSMVLLDFVNRGNHTKTILHFNHNTDYGNKAEKFVKDYAVTHNIPIIIGNIRNTKCSAESWEEYWRNERYGFFKQFVGNIAIAHHLGDAMETYVFYMLNGKDWSIPLSRDNIVRPLLATEKYSICKWAEKYNVPYMDDPGNDDLDYTRCKIRHELLPKCLEVNPGLSKVVKKKIMSNYKG